MTIIVALAFFLRVAGIHFGLPSIYHQDEPIIVNHAMAIGTAGWNTHFFVVPPFTIYLLFFLYAGFFLVGHFAGLFHGKTDFAIWFLKDPSLFYLMGRFGLGVLFGTANVFLLGKLGKRFFSERAGIFAALFLALVLIHVQHSHYIYPDIPLTFIATVFVYCSILLLNVPSTKNYLCAGFAWGWGLATKYTAFYFLPAFLIVHFLVSDKKILGAKSLKKVALFGLCSVFLYAAIAPYTFLDWAGFYTQVLRQAGAESPTGLTHHLFYSVMGGTGILFFALALIGFVSLVRKKQKEAVVLGAFFLSYYFINVFFSQPFARYMLPVIPVLALSAGLGAEVLFGERLRCRWLARGVVLLALLEAAIPTGYSDALFFRQDTRTQCMKWFERNVGSGSVIVVDNRFFAPHFTQTSAQIQEKYEFLKGEEKDETRKKRLDLMLQAIQGKKTYTIYTLTAAGKEAEERAFLFSRPFVRPHWDEFAKIKADYLILNYAEVAPEAQALKEAMADRLALVAKFSPYRDPSQKLSKDPYASTAAPQFSQELFSRSRLGPYLEVYKVKR